MALSLEECRAMAAAAKKHRVHLIVGPSHSFDAPDPARPANSSRRFGRVRMITAFNFTDFLYRPRMPDELKHALLNQSAHHVDIVAAARRHAAEIGARSRGRVGPCGRGSLFGASPLQGELRDPASTAATRISIPDEFTGWIGELGQKKDPLDYGAARKALARRGTSLRSRTRETTAAQNSRRARRSPTSTSARSIVSCDKADLRPAAGRRHDLRGRRAAPRAPPADARAARRRDRRSSTTRW